MTELAGDDGAGVGAAPAPAATPEARERCRNWIGPPGGSWPPTGGSTSPCRPRGLYPHQWSWDSAFVAIGLRHLSAAPGAAGAGVAVRRAVARRARAAHRLRPARARRRLLPRPDVLALRVGGAERAGACRPPASSSRRCTRSPPGRRYRADPAAGPRAAASCARIYPRLVAWHRYLDDPARPDRQRPDGGRAPVGVRAWTTARPGTSRWRGSAGARRRVHAAPTSHHAAAADRPTDRDYGRYVRLARDYRDAGYADSLRRARVRRRGPAVQRAAGRRRARARVDRRGARRTTRGPHRVGGRPGHRRAGVHPVRPGRRHLLPPRRAHRLTHPVVHRRRPGAARRAGPAGRRRAGQDRAGRPVPAARGVPAAVVRPHRPRPRREPLLARAGLGEHQLAVLARAAAARRDRRSPTTCATGCWTGCARRASGSTSIR